MAKKKLSAKQKQAREKASKRRRNKRYYLKRKIYKAIAAKEKKLVDSRAVHAVSVPTYQQFWFAIEHYWDSTKQACVRKERIENANLAKEASNWLEKQVIINRRTAHSGRANLFKKVRDSIKKHKDMIKTMGSSTDAIAYIRHLADDQGSLSWKDYVGVVSLAGCIIGGYVKARGDAQHGFRLTVVGQPTIEEFRYISGNWRFAKDFIKSKLGPNEQEAYGS